MSRKSDTDESYYMTGTLVKVIDQESFFTNMFSRNYVEFQVEGTQRFKIQKVLQTQTSQLILTCDVLIYDEENNGNPINIMTKHRLRCAAAGHRES